MPETSEYSTNRDPMNPMGGPPVSAYGLASLGRGGDTALMHVSPREIQALQKLAEQHGGSLTINPETGLPEAGFLSDILPAIVGVGAAVAAPFTAGTSLAALGPILSNPLAMGLITGGITGLATGDWKKGLLGGLGAYGGASLGSAFAPSLAPATAAEVGAVAPAYTIAGREAAAQTAKQALVEEATQKALTNPATFGSFGGFKLAPNLVAPAISETSPIASTAATNAAKTGLSSLYPTAGAFGLTGGKGLLASGAAALAPALFGASTETSPFKPVDPWGGKGSTQAYEGPWSLQRDVSFPDEDRYLADTSEYNYFSPAQYVSATGKRMARGGIAHFAAGGAPLPPTHSYGEGIQPPVTPVAKPAVAPVGAPAPVVAKPIALTHEYGQGIQPPVVPAPAPKPAITTPNFASPYFASPFNFSNFSNLAKVYTPPPAPPPLSLIDEEIRLGYANKLANNDRARALQYLQNPYFAPVGMPTVQNSASSNSYYYYPPQSQSLFGRLLFGRRYATGGIADLARGGDASPHKGGYLDGPGDGMSDSIPATIEDKQPARLADGEFVVPADVVSHIGNGSSKAGAKRLYTMMDKIRHARTGTVKQGKEINPDKYLPA